MSINAQFLFFYVDELLKVHWVEWSEKYLNKVPDQSYATRKGFQDITGSVGSSLRTRALECFKLGLINGRLISSKDGGKGVIPKGWESICSDKAIHTNVGYLSYVIGKALQEPNVKGSAISSFNALCSLLILGIGFKYKNRWYTTVYIYLFVKTKTESILGRKIDNTELRFLAGAVFNTLDSQHADQLIDAYTQNSDDFNLCFKFVTPEVCVKLFAPKEFVDTCSDSEFNINNIENHKAALFWTNTERGIFSRAMNGTGQQLLISLGLFDQSRAEKKEENILSSFYEGIVAGEISDDILFLLLNVADFNKYTKDRLLKVMKELNDGVIDSLDLIKRKTGIIITDKFYLHDEISIQSDIVNLELTITKEGLPLLPEVGNTLILTTGEEFTLTSVETIEDNIVIESIRETQSSL